jgi:hypothetical protein
VTPGRLVLAWLLVAVWFAGAVWVGRRAVGAALPTDDVGRRRVAAWTAAEAAVVTLLASLWFDSLGSGGWWLLFSLVGVLAAFPVRLQAAIAAGTLPRRPDILLALVDAVRYLAAGAILAWRLR